MELSVRQPRETQARWLILGLVVVWLAAFMTYGVWRYQHFTYNALDLAIYHQALSETAAGRFFNFTIHPHSYLGDHTEFFLVLVAPFLWIMNHALTLVVIQALALAAGVLALDRLVRRSLAPPWRLVIAAVYLLQPFLQNAAVFEFHGLVFVVPLLLWAIVAYREQRYGWWLLALGCLLTVREDVALIVLMFGVLAAIDRRHWHWIVPPIVIGVAWFAASLWLIGHVNGSGGYKYAIFYRTLGDTPREIARRLLTDGKLWATVLANALQLGFWSMASVAFLAILRPKILLLGLLTFGELILLDRQGVNLAMLAHYAVPFAPLILVATIDGLQWIRSTHHTRKIFTTLQREPVLLGSILTITAVAASLILGPLAGWWQPVKVDGQWDAIRRSFLEQVEPDSRLTATYSPLTHLAARRELYSLHYGWLGHRQFSQQPYTLPESDELLIDGIDMLFLQEQYQPRADEDYAGGDERIRDWLATSQLSPVAAVDSLVLFKRQAIQPIELFSRRPAVPSSPDGTAQLLIDGLDLVNTVIQPPEACQAVAIPCQVLPVSLTFQVTKIIDRDYHLSFRLRDGEHEVRRRFYPMAYGLDPTSNWQPGEIVTVHYWFWASGLPAGTYQASVQLIDVGENTHPNTLRSLKLDPDAITDVGPAIDLDPVPLGESPT